MYFANGPPNFSNGTSLKNYYYISLTVYCIFFFSQLAFCQLKTLQLLNTNHMYIQSQHLLITLEDVALQC